MTATVRTLNPSGLFPAEKWEFGAADWTVYDTGTHAALAAVVAAVAGVQHAIAYVTLSFAAAPVAACVFTIKDGTTIIWQAEIATDVPRVVNFDFSKRPLRAAAGAAISANLTDPGVAILATISASGISSRSITFA